MEFEEDRAEAWFIQLQISCQAQVQVQVRLLVSTQEICHKHLQIMLKSRVGVMTQACNTKYCIIASDWNLNIKTRLVVDKNKP